MKRKFKIPILAAIVGLVLAFGASAFKSVGEHKKTETEKPFANVYFEYGGANESEGQLETYGNWQEITGGLPGENPCDPGSIVCVSHLDNTTLQAQTGMTNAEKFVNYLRRTDVNPVTYVQGHSDYEKQ